jgi:hypothetical protein
MQSSRPLSHAPSRRGRAVFGALVAGALVLLFPRLYQPVGIIGLHDAESVGQLDPTAFAPFNSTSPLMTLSQWRSFESKLHCWTAAGSWQKDDTRLRHDPDSPKREEYYWVPTCTAAALPEYSRARFCALLRGRNIHIVGDSLASHFHQYLQDKAGIHPPGRLEGNEFVLGYGFRNSSSVCQDSPFGMSRVPHARSIRLHDRPADRLFDPARRPLERRDHYDALRMSDYFGPLTLSAGVRPDIVILNRGQWVTATAPLLADVDDTLRFLREHHPHALIIWRSTPVPTPFCTNYTGPIPSPIPREQLRTGGSGGGAAGDYRWHEIFEQQPVVRRFLEERWPGVVFMDVGPAMDLRPDSHGSPKDCVHFAKNAAMEVWLRYLQGILAELDPFLPAPTPEYLADIEKLRTAAR